jgi:hypothetical protein
MEGKNYKNAIGLLEKAKEWPENIGVGKPYDPDERAQDFLLSKAYEALGETQKSLLSKNAVIKYTRENPSSNSLNHLFGLLALQTTEGPINIENLSSNIRSFAGKGQTKSLLALAFYEKDNSAINALKSENIVPKDVWDIAAWAVGQYSQSEKP